MSLDAETQRGMVRSLERGRSASAALLAAVAVAALGGVGCSLDAMQPASSARVAAADVDTCRRRIIEAIWRGENVGGPRCAGSAALAAEQTGDVGRRIQIVCERTHIRTILSGEAAPPFTQEACTTYAPKYEQATLDRACKEAARLQKRRDEDLTPAQSAACETHLFGKAERTARSSAGASSVGGGGARRENTFAAVPRSSLSPSAVRSDPARSDPARSDLARSEVTSSGLVPPSVEPPGAASSTAPSHAVAPSAVTPSAVTPSAVTPSAVAPGAVTPSAVTPGAVAPGAVTPSAVTPSAVASHVVAPGAVAPSSTEPRAAAPAPDASDDGGFVLAACENRYVESIWKGEDVTGGARCAGYVSADGAAPQYRFARLQNVCEGAEIRAVRKREALPAFTAQACQVVFAARTLPPAPPAGAPAVADASAAPEPPIRVGLDEAAIASTVDANWRSIGRDCLNVAPRSGSVETPGNTPVTVTIMVAASGRVRSVSARASGHRELEMCIESSVRGWVFPSAAGDTEVGIPLMFAGE